MMVAPQFEETTMRFLLASIALALALPAAAAPKKDDTPKFMSKCRVTAECPKGMVCGKRKGKDVGVCSVPLAPPKKR